MSYLNQISVAEAKDYLKLDGNENDQTLELLIYSACVHFEKSTNHLIYKREKFYNAGRIYDVPIEDVSTLVEKSLYFVSDEDVTLQVGYDIGALPIAIKNCILDLVMLDFYNIESDDSKMRRKATHRTINDYKRFLF